MILVQTGGNSNFPPSLMFDKTVYSVLQDVHITFA